ncbi:hypothetical protein ERJ75_000725600 [Trypanosoma vivax]|uniref:Uncharacterized protein n=1 Tax=Trypanosoma vivax (strain Y486) TaxID=1055687 RepID=G0TX09_TRYVY|nr:hypothetical protein ERJ75_000725600 [Trypanosoma vivax]CCC48498.1 conserved hypothetical protein [Trypanosoma vivax Y486]
MSVLQGSLGAESDSPKGVRPEVEWLQLSSPQPPSLRPTTAPVPRYGTLKAQARLHSLRNRKSSINVEEIAKYPTQYIYEEARRKRDEVQMQMHILKTSEEKLQKQQDTLAELLREKEELENKTADAHAQLPQEEHVIRLRMRLDNATTSKKDAVNKINNMDECLMISHRAARNRSTPDARGRLEMMSLKQSVNELSREVSRLYGDLALLQEELARRMHNHSPEEHWESLSDGVGVVPVSRDELERLIRERNKCRKRVQKATEAHVAALQTEMQTARTLSTLERRKSKATGLKKSMCCS